MDKKLLSYLKYLNQWMFNYVKQAKTKGVIIGISGGIDSAVVANLAALTKHITVLGVWMNIDNSPLDKKCVQALKQQKQFEIIDIDLTKQFHELIKHLKLKDKLSIANLKARLRMLTLYALAQQHDLLVAGTSNADEMYMGYFTKYGDGAADILPLVNLLKNDVYEAAKILKVPQIIINRAPSAGLYDGQTDEKEMGVTYDQIDKFLLKGKTKTPKIRNIIISSHTRNVHKLQLPARPKAYRKIA